MTSEFWQAWGDGLAEANTYSLTMPGGVHGTCTTITAVEPFSKSLRVKVDAHKHAKADTARAVRLSVRREYGTIREMLSAWAWLESFEKVVEGMPAKICFSRHENAGQSWSQIIWGTGRLTHTLHSYYEDQGDVLRSLAADADSTAEDLLLLTGRRFAWPRLRLGQAYTVPLLTSIAPDRARRVLAWAPAELTLAKDRTTVGVPAGSFRTNAFRANRSTGAKTQIDVEADPPYRVVRWRTALGEEALLTGSVREKQ